MASEFLTAYELLQVEYAMWKVVLKFSNHKLIKKCFIISKLFYQFQNYSYNQFFSQFFFANIIFFCQCGLSRATVIEDTVLSWPSLDCDLGQSRFWWHNHIWNLPGIYLCRWYSVNIYYVREITHVRIKHTGKLSHVHVLTILTISYFWWPDI